MRARLGDELGALAHCSFESFQLDRPLPPFQWEGKTISTATQRQFLKDAARRARAYAESPRGWLYFHGSFGAGKSYLAAAIANHQVAAGRRVRYRTVTGLLDALRSAIRDRKTDELLIDLLSCDLLVLDELAPQHLSEAASDWAFDKIDRLINERLHLPTVITSNRSYDDLVAADDWRAERIADRIAGVSVAIWMPVSSYRRLKEVRHA
jgi:DNA replication protein DnaC